MKYIMFERKIRELTYAVPIIFPDTLVHRHVASAIKNFGDNAYGLSNKVLSAGDITLDVVSCHGFSTTLNIGADSEDVKIINSYNYLHGLK